MTHETGAATGRDEFGGPEPNGGGNHRQPVIGLQKDCGSALGGATSSGRASGQFYDHDLRTAARVANIEADAYVGVSAQLFEECKFEACTEALEDSLRALDRGKAALLTLEVLANG